MPHSLDALHQHHDDDALHHQGLARDLEVLLRRRGALRWLVGAGALPIVGCGGGGDSSSSTTSGTTTGTTTGITTGGATSTTTTGGTTTGTTSGNTASSCSLIPEETQGPYPGDGSNNGSSGLANALALSGIVRSDIRSSIAGASGTAAGVPLTLTLKLVNTGASCASLSGYAVYVWHCDRDGNYSMYSGGAASQNYLRGVQSTGSDGTVTFTTIFPACYSGRWPHVHFEIYRSANTATSFTNKLRTSQLALPADACQAVYDGASGYSASVTNFSRVSLSSDNVFSDGSSTQVATVTGSVSAGYAATLTVGISA